MARCAFCKRYSSQVYYATGILLSSKKKTEPQTSEDRPICSICYDTQSRGRQETDSNMGSLDAPSQSHAMEMLREPILEIDESIDNPTIPAEIPAEQPGSNSSNTDKDDDDVVIMGSFQLPQSFQIVDLSIPEHIPPKRHRQRNMDYSVVGTLSLSCPNSSSSCSSSSNNSGQSSDTVSLNCAICLDNCRKPTATLCGHIYCEKCIKAAIHATKKCPMCKRKLNPKSTHPLYFN